MTRHALKVGAIGVLPVGALGVSFFYHLTRRLTAIDGSVCFVERKGSHSARAIKDRGQLLIHDGRQLRRISSAPILRPDMLACFEAGQLPEVILVCTHPDQLLGIVSGCVELLERICERGQLPEADFPFPKIILSSNGIYFQRIRQIFIEKMEEATLLGRLPDLWPDVMPRIVSRLLRGVTIQTGLREGAGADAVYHPGEPGITRIAGGDAASRERCRDVLVSRGGWFELAAHSSATRLEFDKAMVNLAANFLGQIYAINESGQFAALKVEQVFTPEHEPEIRELTRHVLEVGQAVRAYSREEDFETLFAHLKATALLHRTHVPSSLQWLGLKLRLGQLSARLSPTESWLIEPLIRYARAADLEETSAYFEGLKDRLLRKLSLAAQCQ